MTQQKGPSRPDPVANDNIRRSGTWVLGAVAALLLCILLVPRLLMAAGASESASMGIGQLGALATGIVCIIAIRRIWRS